MPTRSRPTIASLVRATLLLTLEFVISLAAFNAAQAQTGTPYFLLPGSQISIQCPICGLVRQPIPISGTFNLVSLTPLPPEPAYFITNVTFYSASTNDPAYTITGLGTYLFRLNLFQDVSMELAVTGAVDQFVAEMTNATPKPTLPWPDIGFVLDQTNGTAARQMTLTLLAAPIPKILTVTADLPSQSINLTWPTNSGTWRLLRSTNVSGAFSPISGPLSNASYTDPGTLTNLPAAFYQLANP
jgi:hypothetical protein